MEFEQKKQKREHNNTPDLPHDIVEEILARVPAVRLCRLRCVSSSWATLLASDEFVELHLRRANHGHPKLFRPPHTWWNCEVPIYSWEPDLVLLLLRVGNFGDRSPLSTTSSCRGLFLVRGLDLKHLFNTFHHYYVFNPSTGDPLALPDGSPPMDAFHTPSRPYWFDNLFGLGYDSSTKEYKVARVYTYLSSINFTSIWSCEILTLGTSMHWRPAAKQPPSKIPCRHMEGVFSNGSLHWMCIDSTSPDSGYILFLDIHDETFGTIQLPQGIQISHVGTLTKLDGRLCFHCSSDGYSEEAIWMKQDHKAGRWEKHCAFDRQAWPTAGRELLGNYDVTPLAMYYGYGPKRKFMFVSNNDVVFAIDSNNGALEILIFPDQMDSGWQGRFAKHPQLQLFEESLVFVANSEQVTCYSLCDNENI